jgi:hypothetical protein
MNGIPDANRARPQPLANSQLNQKQRNAFHNHHLQKGKKFMPFLQKITAAITYNQVGYQEGAASILLQQKWESPNIA